MIFLLSLYHAGLSYYCHAVAMMSSFDVDPWDVMNNFCFLVIFFNAAMPVNFCYNVSGSKGLIYRGKWQCFLTRNTASKN